MSRAPFRYAPPSEVRCAARIQAAGSSRWLTNPPLERCRWKAVVGGPYCAKHAELAKEAAVVPVVYRDSCIDGCDCGDVLNHGIADAKADW